MKKALRYLIFKFKDAFNGSASAISLFLFIISPFIGLFIGWYSGTAKGSEFSFGGELIVVLILVLIACALRIYSEANAVSIGGMPIPKERFTIDAGGGEIQIETARLQELILYIAELEDWLYLMGYADDEPEGSPRTQ